MASFEMTTPDVASKKVPSAFSRNRKARQSVVSMVFNLAAINAAKQFVRRRIVEIGVLFCVVCAGILLGFAVLPDPLHRASRNLPCVGEECQEVARHTESLMDHSVGPCVDFYRHVCGRWINNKEHPSSYMIDVARNFTHTLHTALTLDYTQGEHHGLLQGAALYYRSCVTYLGNKVEIKAATNELFKALDLHLPTWFNQTDPQNFFLYIIRLSFLNRLPTLFSANVIHTDPEMAFIIERRPPLHSLFNAAHHEEFEKYLRYVTEIIGRQHASYTVIEEVVNLDKKRAQRHVQEIDEDDALDDVECGIFPPVLWGDALRHTFAKFMRPESVSLRIRGPLDICEDLNDTLVNTKSAARPLYILDLLSWHILVDDYNLFGNDAGGAVNRVCFYATARAFENVWLDVVSHFLSITGHIEDEIDVHMMDIKKGIMDQVLSRTWMGESEKSVILRKLDKIRFIEFNRARMTRRHVDCTNVGLITNRSFASNMAYAHSAFNDTCLFPALSQEEAFINGALTGTTLAAEPWTSAIILPHVFAMPPMYYRHVQDDEYINIAQLGTQVARKILSILDPNSNGTNAARNWSDFTLVKHTIMLRCYEDVLKRFNEKLTDKKFDDVFSVVEAVRVSYARKRQHDRDIVTRNPHRVRASDAMFYKRVCLALCAGPNAPADANTLDYATAHSACLLAVGSMPEFVDAFECAHSDPMNAIHHCYSV